MLCDLRLLCMFVCVYVCIHVCMSVHVCACVIVMYERNLRENYAYIGWIGISVFSI